MRKLSAILLAAALALIPLAACGQAKPADVPGHAAALTVDREGNEMTPPKQADKIISLAQATTQTLIHLGLADKIVAVDTYSALLPGLPPNLPQVDMLSPDVETLLTLNADLVLCSAMMGYDGSEPLKPLKDAGVSIAAIPSSVSVAAIKEDLAFIADLVGRHDEGAAIIAELERGIEEVKAAVAAAPKAGAYFEVAAAPQPYSCGANTFINEMIDIAGGANIFADTDGWIAVSEEQVVVRNPEFIFTNVNYLPDPVGEIQGRASLKGVAAVAGGNVYYVDNYASSLPNEYIIDAIREMAAFMHPDLWQN